MKNKCLDLKRGQRVMVRRYGPDFEEARVVSRENYGAYRWWGKQTVYDFCYAVKFIIDDVVLVTAPEDIKKIDYKDIIKPDKQNESFGRM